MRKKRIFIVLIVLLLLGVFGYFYFNRKNLAPSVNYTAMVVSGIDAQSISTKLFLEVDNPMPVGFSIDSLEYQIFIADFKVMESWYRQKLELGGRSTSKLMLPMQLYNDTLLNILKTLENQDVDSTNYTIRGSFYADVPMVGYQKVEFDQTVMRPLIRLPKVALSKFELGALEEGKLTTQVSVKVVNPNDAEAKLEGLSYKLILGEDKRVLTGTKDGQILIPANDSMVMTLPMEVSLAETGGAALEVLFKGSNLKFEFFAETQTISDKEIMNAIPVKIYTTGTLGDIRELQQSL